MTASSNTPATSAVNAEIPARYLRREDAARYVGCSLRQLDTLKSEGAIPFHRLGRRLIVFRVDDLERFMSKCRVARAGETHGGQDAGAR